MSGWYRAAGLSEYQARRPTVRNPPMSATNGAAPRRWRSRRMEAACRTRPLYFQKMRKVQLRVVARRRVPLHHQRPGLPGRRRYRRRPGPARPRRLVPQAHNDRLAAGEQWRQVAVPFELLPGSLPYSAIPLSSVCVETTINCSLSIIQGIGPVSHLSRYEA